MHTHCVWLLLQYIYIYQEFGVYCSYTRHIFSDKLLLMKNIRIFYDENLSLKRRYVPYADSMNIQWQSYNHVKRDNCTPRKKS